MKMKSVSPISRLFALIFVLLTACSSTTFEAKKTQASSLNPWPSIQDHLALQQETHRNEIKPYLTYYCQHAYQIEKTFNQTLPTLAYVSKQTHQANIPSEIAFMPYIESHFSQTAHSRTGALGLWQMMPGTASGFGLRINWWVDQRMDLQASTRSALSYLRYLYDYFNHDWLLAIAAYDAGEGTVKKAIKRNKKNHKPTDFWSLSLPAETKAYVPKILALSAIIAQPQQCHLTLPSDYEPLEPVTIPHQISFETIAQLADIHINRLNHYNRHFLHQITERQQPEQTIMLPSAYANRLKKNLKDQPKNHIEWRHHQVKSGDTLNQIAKTFKTSSQTIQKVNHLQSLTIQPGQDLLIPAFAHASTPLIDTPTMSQHNYHEKGPKQLIYTIKSGDTLSSIAAPYPITPAMIRYWNPNTSRAPLKPNHKLVLWLPRISHYDHYTVVSGDTLSQIAQRFGVSVKSLLAINPLGKKAMIHPGQQLKVPISETNQGKHPSYYTVRKGDSLSSIAHRHHIRVAQLIDWNDLTENSIIHPGQQIVIFR